MVPLRLCAYVGSLTAAATLVYASYILMRTLIRGVDDPGYASLLVAILFFGSLQLIGIRLLGECISSVGSTKAPTRSEASGGRALSDAAARRSR
jgi:hypothetical protein